MPITYDESPAFEVLPSIFEPPLISRAVRAIDGKLAKQEFAATAGAQRKGCYVFAITRGRSFVPWYVGKATVRFAQEVFTDRNCKMYCEALSFQKSGRPKIILVAHPTAAGATNLKWINKLENTLIEECGIFNPDLRNARKMRVQKLVIRGVVNAGAGKPSAAAGLLRGMMGR